MIKSLIINEKSRQRGGAESRVRASPPQQLANIVLEVLLRAVRKEIPTVTRSKDIISI